jgi:hypothetical protein
MKNKNGNVAVIAIIIIVVAFVAGAGGWFAKKTQAPVVAQPAPVAKTQTATQLQSTQQEKAQVIDSESFTISELYKNYPSLSLDNKKILKIAADFNGGDDPWISIVKNQKESVIYFIVATITNERLKSEDPVLARHELYALNTNTNELKKLFTEEAANFYEELYGVDGNKLIVSKIDASRWPLPDPCVNFWKLAYESTNESLLKSFDLSSSGAILIDYKVSKEKYDNEVAKEKKCYASI